MTKNIETPSGKRDKSTKWFKTASKVDISQANGKWTPSFKERRHNRKTELWIDDNREAIILLFSVIATAFRKGQSEMDN